MLHEITNTTRLLTALITHSLISQVWCSVVCGRTCALLQDVVNITLVQPALEAVEHHHSGGSPISMSHLKLQPCILGVQGLLHPLKDVCRVAKDVLTKQRHIQGTCTPTHILAVCMKNRRTTYIQRWRPFYSAT